MIGRKNKGTYNKILKQFAQYHSSKELKEYKELESIYDQIKSFYKEKTNNNEIELKIEKIRIERNLGKQLGESTRYIITFGISILGALMSISIQEVLKNINPHYWILNFIAIISLYFLIMSSIGKEAERAKPRDIMLNISLKVIEDLEKEINENRLEQQKEAEYTYFY